MNSILNHSDSIQWDEPLHKMSKFNHYINGINGRGNLVQVDTKHNAFYEFPFKKNEDIIGYEHLNNSLGKGYFFITSKHIYFEDGHVVLESNKKSDF